ncbi:MAG: type II toxin-antitoxin system HicB family antitoxin [Candidatus Sericytochromatia bacterium]
MKAYIGIIHKDPGSCYGISFPDFPGCISAGDTLQEALLHGSEALGAHLRLMQQDGDPIPEPSELDVIMKEPDFADGMPALITPSLQHKGKAVRVNITLDEYLLEDIDAHVGRLGVTRSAFLAEAARAALRG